jgi:MFS transporter, Spinster family, sphingosine-1-phosphate transporter
MMPLALGDARSRAVAFGGAAILVSSRGYQYRVYRVAESRAAKPTEHEHLSPPPFNEEPYVSDVTPSASVPTAASETSPRVGVYAWYVFWLMCGINFFNYADRFIFTAVSDTLKSQFGFNDFQFGVFGSAFLIVYSLVAFPLGYLAERLSRKLVVGVGVAVWSVATLLTGRSFDFNSMLLARSVVGVGEGSYYPSGTPLLAAWFPTKRRASILAWWGSSALFGAGIGFLFGGFFDYPDKWRIAFYISAVPGLILATLMLFLRKRARSEGDPEPVTLKNGMSIVGTIKRCWQIPTFRVILFQHALGFFPLAAISYWLVIYLSHAYGAESHYGTAAGLGKSTGSILAGALLVLGGIVGGIYGGAWANRMRRKYIGARVRTGGLGFLWAAPFVAITLGAPFVLQSLPAYTALAPTTQVEIGVGIFALMGLSASFFLNVYNGPTSAALQDVLPPNLRAAGGGLELTLAHLLGDVYATAAVGAIADAFSARLGGEQIGLALLVTCPLALVAAGIVGIWGSRFYKRDVEALGASAEAMVGL